MNDGWTVVGKKGRHERLVPTHTDGCSGHPDEHEVDDRSICTTVEQCLASLSHLEGGLKQCAFTRSLQAAFIQIAEKSQSSRASEASANYNTMNPSFAHRPPWSRVSCLRCYGIGSPTKSLNARAQLALIRVLKQWLPDGIPMLFYDPVFTPSDKALLQQLDLSLLDEKSASEHQADRLTFFYMPHCDASLYDDVLDANWHVARMPNVIILGNSFETIHERWCGPTYRRRVGKPGRVLALVDHAVVTECSLDGSGFRVENAFNDTSLHACLPQCVQDVPDLFVP